jgi:DNA invertase Pin-like site-specific DNA recombinase
MPRWLIPRNGTMAAVGYARTSTRDQIAGFEAQIRDLKAARAERIYQEHVSSVAKRPELAAMMDYVRAGDTVLVTKIDRLARSVPDLLHIVDQLKAKGVELRILNLGLDTGTATGKMMLTVIGAIATFEREMMLERQIEGIAAAKAAGRYKGRAPTVRVQTPEIIRLHQEGLSNGAIARQLGVHRSNVGRVLKASAG